MIFNYVDIGTSYFETSVDLAKENETVLLVEPIMEYLEKIPSKIGVYKANFAISNQRGFLDLFYVPLKDTYNLNLPSWIYGCNKLGSKHPTVDNLLTPLNLNHLMVSTKVPTITFNNLIELYSIEKIINLKIDTEGHDHIILQMVYDSIIKKEIVEMNSITFEYIQAFNNTNDLDNLITLFEVNLGYKLTSIEGDNRILTKK